MHKQWTSKVFTLAGLLLTAVATLVAVGIAAGGQEPPRWFYATVFLLFGGALLSGVAGLFGLYPALRRSAPRLAGAGGALASLAALAALVWIAIAVSGRAPWELSDAFFAVVMLGGLGTAVLSFAVFGVGLLRTSIVPRAVGVLLLLGAASFCLPIVASALEGVLPEWIPFAIFGTWAVVFFVTASVLRRGTAMEAPRAASLARADQ